MILCSIAPTRNQVLGLGFRVLGLGSWVEGPGAGYGAAWCQGLGFGVFVIIKPNKD